MNIHGIEYDSMLNGDGLRAIIWVSGCNHKCPGCHNPQTWNPESGRSITTDDINRIFNYLNKGYPAGVTFSGGDPLYPGNRDTVLYLCKLFKSEFPNKTLWLYIGYLYEEVENLEIMQYIDVLVDGPFKKDLADVTYHWAGSTNQRVIQLHHAESQTV